MADNILSRSAPSERVSSNDKDIDIKVENSAKRSRQARDFKTVIVVLVGSEEKRFAIHQDAICSKSRFFTSECSSYWSEGQEKLIHLPDATPECFQAYCEWIYTNKVTVDNALTWINDLEGAMEEQESLLKLYLLADKVDDVALRNETMHLLVERVHRYLYFPSPDIMRHVWGCTTTESLLRRMLVDRTFAGPTPGYVENVSLYPHELTREVAVVSLGLLYRNGDHNTFSERASEYLEPEPLEEDMA